jgi:hypothetical protein
MTDKAYPRIRPHGAFYLIPVFSLIIGIVICVALIVSAAFRMSVKEFPAGSIKYIDVEGPETVLILAYRATASSAHVTKLEKNRYQVTFNSHTNVEFTFLDVNHPETEITMEALDGSTNFYVNEYNSVLKINLPAEGYYLIKSKYNATYTDPFQMLISVGIVRLIKSIVIGIISGTIGFLAAIVSFVLIISKRSFCRRMIREQEYRAQSEAVRL